VAGTFPVLVLRWKDWEIILWFTHEFLRAFITESGEKGSIYTTIWSENRGYQEEGTHRLDLVPVFTGNLINKRSNHSARAAPGGLQKRTSVQEK